MAEANPDLEVDQNAVVDGDQPTIEELKAALEKANGEAAKLRKLKKEIEADRDALKKAKPVDSVDQDYKSLWSEAQERSAKILDKVKNSDISTALTAQLGKAKVDPQFAEAAAKLADRGLIEWDEDSGVSEQSVVAAVQKLKRDFPAMFEKKVGGADIKDVAGGSTPEKTIRRAEFDKLPPAARATKIRDGYKLVD